MLGFMIKNAVIIINIIVLSISLHFPGPANDSCDHQLRTPLIAAALIFHCFIFFTPSIAIFNNFGAFNVFR